MEKSTKSECPVNKTTQEPTNSKEHKIFFMPNHELDSGIFQGESRHNPCSSYWIESPCAPKIMRELASRGSFIFSPIILESFNALTEESFNTIRKKEGSMMKISITTDEGTTIIRTKGEISLHISPGNDEMYVGSTMLYANHYWRVVHETNTECYLMLTNNHGECIFTDISNECKKFENSEFTENELNCLKEVTVEGITGKVFVASKAQLDGGSDWFGGFEWFKNGDILSKRSVGSDYWTSTPDDSSWAWYVDSNGAIIAYYGCVTIPLGFRPCICLDIEKYKEYVDVHNK